MPTAYDRRQIFADVWKWARAFAALGRTSPRSLFSEGLRRVWREVKQKAHRLWQEKPVRVRETGARDPVFGWRRRNWGQTAPYNAW